MGTDVPAPAHVEVAREQEVHAAGLGHLQGLQAPAHHTVRARPRRRHEGVMGDEDLEDARREGREAGADAVDLVVGQAPALPDVRAGRVHAQHRHLVVVEERGEVGGHQAPVAAQRAEEPAREVEERDVVVAGHHQHRRGEPVQERARGLELAAPGALGEVAADHDQVGAGGGQVLEHGLHDPRVLAAVSFKVKP